MTTATLSQAALIAVEFEQAQGARVSQSALVVVASDVPPQSFGAKLTQGVIISVAQEIPLDPTVKRYRMKSLWGFPYLVRKAN